MIHMAALKKHLLDISMALDERVSIINGVGSSDELNSIPTWLIMQNNSIFSMAFWCTSEITVIFTTSWNSWESAAHFTWVGFASDLIFHEIKYKKRKNFSLHLARHPSSSEQSSLGVVVVEKWTISAIFASHSTSFLSYCCCCCYYVTFLHNL